MYVPLLFLILSSTCMASSLIDPASEELIKKLLAEQGWQPEEHVRAIQVQDEALTALNIFIQEEDRLRLAQVRATLTADQNAQLNGMQEMMTNISKRDKDKIKPDLMNVHEYVALLRPYAATVVELNQALGLNSEMPLVDCVRHLKQLRQPLGDGFADPELNQLQAWIQTGATIEPETTLHSLKLLSCCVDYLCKSSNQLVDVYMFFDKLAENKKPAGCYAGYVGRMLACQITYLLRIFRPGKGPDCN